MIFLDLIFFIFIKLYYYYIVLLKVVIIMPHTYLDLKNSLKKRIKIDTLKSIIKKVKKLNPTLWCRNPPRNFIEKSIVVALYKDAFSVSYNDLKIEINNWLPLAKKSLEHNIQKLRECFSNWANKHIHIGTLSDWESAARRMKFPKKLKKVVLWIDSTDFRKS